VGTGFDQNTGKIMFTKASDDGADEESSIIGEIVEVHVNSDTQVTLSIWLFQNNLERKGFRASGIYDDDDDDMNGPLSREGDGARAFTDVILEAKAKAAWYKVHENHVSDTVDVGASAARVAAWSAAFHEDCPFLEPETHGCLVATASLLIEDEGDVGLGSDDTCSHILELKRFDGTVAGTIEFWVGFGNAKVPRHMMEVRLTLKP